MLVIGFTGPARSGKDTAASFFLEKDNYVKYSFAYPLKEMLRIGFGLTESELEGDNKEEPLTRLGLDKSPRQLMQTMGTEWGRNMIDTNLWLKLAQRNWELLKDSGKNMIIADVRFENEADFVRKNGVLIHIHRPDCMEINTHPSENGVKRHPDDYVVANDGDIQTLKEKIANIVLPELEIPKNIDLVLKMVKNSGIPIEKPKGHCPEPVFFPKNNLGKNLHVFFSKAVVKEKHMLKSRPPKIVYEKKFPWLYFITLDDNKLLGKAIFKSEGAKIDEYEFHHITDAKKIEDKYYLKLWGIQMVLENPLKISTGDVKLGESLTMDQLMKQCGKTISSPISGEFILDKEFFDNYEPILGDYVYHLGGWYQEDW